MRPLNNCIDAYEQLKKYPVIAIFDTETTGLSPRKGDRVWQFSGCYLVHNNGKYTITNEINILMNPEIPIPPKVTEITGVKTEDLQDKPLEADEVAKIKDFFDKADIISGYNVSFDINFIDEMYQRQFDTNFNPENVIDVMKMAKEQVGLEDVEGHRTLENVAKFYNVFEEGSHNATVDVKNTAKVFFAIIKSFMSQSKTLSKDYPKYKIYSMSGWHKSRELSRIYLTIEEEVNPNVFIKLYYDRYKNEFIVDTNDFSTNFDPSDIYSQMENLCKEKKVSLSTLSLTYKDGKWFDKKNE